MEFRELREIALPLELQSPEARRDLIRLSADAKRRLGLAGEPVELRDSGGVPNVRTVGVAGVISVRGVEVEIRPKFLEINSSTNWRWLLLRLVEIAAGNRFTLTGRTDADVASASFFDHIGAAFAAMIRRAAEVGPVLLYNRRQEELPYLRGRIVLRDQLQMMLTRPGLIAQRVDELHVDNPINRTLKWVARFLRARVRQSSTRTQLDRIDLLIPNVPAELPSLPVVERLYLPDQYTEWRDALDLAKTIARLRSLGWQGDTFAVPGILFDTARTFEQLIERLLAQVVRSRAAQQWAVAHQRSHTWLYPTGAGESPRTATPDNEIRISGQRALLVDAKYKGRPELEKITPPIPIREDVYESTVFLVASDCDRVLLLYPKLESGNATPGDLRSYRADLFGRKVLFATATVDCIRLAEQGLAAEAVELDAKLNQLLSMPTY